VSKRTACAGALHLGILDQVPKPYRPRPTVLSAFTGLGGLDLGLEKAGFRTIACIEIDKYARASIEANRPKRKLLPTGDISEVAETLSPRDLGIRLRQLGVLAGGPPCQPFSKAAEWSENGRAGLADPRSRFLVAFLRLAERFLPRLILIENVPGFARGRTSAISFIQAALDRINRLHRTRYRLEWRILNAAKYGIPQRRERAILIARRDGGPIAWPTPSHATRPVRAYDALCKLKCEDPPAAKGYWSGLLPSIPEGANYLYHTRRGGGVELFGERRRYWSFLLKLAQDQPAWTIPAHPGPATGPFHWDNRPLTVKELLRLQSFPVSWKVRGNRLVQVKQVGNATPPLLAEVIGRALGTSVFGMKYDGAPHLRIPRQRRNPIPRRRKPVPARYLKHRGRHPAHPGEGAGPGALHRERMKVANQKARHQVRAGSEPSELSSAAPFARRKRGEKRQHVLRRARGRRAGPTLKRGKLSTRVA